MKPAYKNKWGIFLSLVLMGVICGCDRSAKHQSAEEKASAVLVKQGKVVYMANCIACHNVETHKDGSLGPAIAGSSLELLQFRVLQAQYPEGYTPKRTTHLMVPLSHLKNDIQALHAFLNQ